MERKDEKSLHKFCTNCGASKLKDWSDLTSDEKFLAERTSAGKLSAEELKLRRFCARCFYAGAVSEERRA